MASTTPLDERYTIKQSLGEDNFGCVYEAYDNQLDRKVAIKRLQANSYVDHVELRDRLLSEAKVLAELNHPHIVSIYDVYETPGGGEIVMELINADALDAFIEEHGKLSIDDFLLVAVQLLNALNTAHEHGVIHANIKPSNILLTKETKRNFSSKIIDFGLSPVNVQEDLAVTAQHHMLSALHFMAPELVDGSTATPQSDIYALGCVFYYMLTGRLPFQSNDSDCQIASQLADHATPLRELLPEAPSGFCQWVESHIYSAPEKRVASCADSLDALLQLKGIEPLEKFTEVYPNTPLSSTRLHSLSTLSKANVAVSAHQQKEFSKKKGISSMTKSKDLVPIAKRYARARPEELWYFAVDNVRKGPLNFEKVCELIAKGYIRKDDTLWHVRLGQWTKAEEVSEFKDDFAAAKSMPPRPIKTNRILPTGAPAPKNIQAAMKPSQQPAFEDEQPLPPVELAITCSLTVMALMGITLFPHLWQHILLGLSAALILFSFIYNRYRMSKTHTGWLIAGLALPVLSDFIYGLVKPTKGAPSMLTMILSGAFVYYALTHRSYGDFLSHPSFDLLTDFVQKYL